MIIPHLSDVLRRRTVLDHSHTMLFGAAFAAATILGAAALVLLRVS